MNAIIKKPAKNDNKSHTNPAVASITVKELYYNFMHSIIDIVWEDGHDIESFTHIISALSRGDTAGIREAFDNGYTMQMLPDKIMCIFDNTPSDIELRILNSDGEIVTVLVNDEMKW